MAGDRRLSHQNVSAAIGESDDQVHQDNHQVVMPAGAFLAPEAGEPGENLFLDRAEHDEDETEGGQLSQDSEGHAETGKAGELRENCGFLR
jgi:hypothetical protein